jgi:PRC-barrel domain
MLLFIGGRLSASCNCSRDREKESRSYHIHEILIEPVAGQVRFALLSVGGFLGIGNTKIAVPWQAFQIIEEDGKLKWVLDATREQLQNAPRVEGKNYDRLYAQETAEPVYVYWCVLLALFSLLIVVLKSEAAARRRLTGKRFLPPGRIFGVGFRQPRDRTRGLAISPGKRRF